MNTSLPARRSCWFCLSLAGVAAHATTLIASPPEVFTFSNVNSDGVLNSSANSVTNAAVLGGFTLRRLDISGTLTSVNAATWSTDSRVLVTAPGGSTVLFQPFLAGSVFTTLNFTSTILVPAVIDPVGSWSLRFYEAIDDGGPGNVDARWNVTFSFSDQLPPAPAATDLGSIFQPGATGQVSVGVSEVKWFTFMVTRTIGSRRGTYLDVDTVGSAIAAQQGQGNFPDDAEIGLYDSSGRRVADDDDSGPGYAGALSFGTGVRPGTSDGLPFDGRHGTLTPGRYYLAVGAHNLTFQPLGWGVAANGNQSGTVTINLRTNVLNAPPCAADFNGDGATSSQDFFDFIVSFFANDIQTDVNLDGAVTSQDFFDFLAAFFAGC